MKEQITFQDFAGIDFGKGKTEVHISDVLHAVWPSGICLTVSAFRYTPYYVMLSREDTPLTCIDCDSKTEVLSHVRNIVRDINAGKFRNKQTYREQAFRLVQERNLTSYMNDTKWLRFLEIVNEKLPFRPPYVYKLLSDAPDREDIQPFRNIPRSPHCYCSECFPQRFYEIEYVRIMPKYAVNHGGLLVEKLEIFDETQELITELDHAHIPCQTDNQEIIIFGYR